MYTFIDSVNTTMKLPF